jgi:hypothetical protein
MDALDYNGNIISDRNKARMDYIKLNLLINSGEVFGFKNYGHNLLDVKNDSSITSEIEFIKKSMTVSDDLSIDEINRKVQGVVSITFKGDNQNAITIEDDYGTK